MFYIMIFALKKCKDYAQYFIKVKTPVTFETFRLIINDINTNE